ncbi:MAG: HAMP domain-containing histidine kinase [Anaerolineaceae bacterium]|nr:HAMP domain-containing histidine kinase [Anaerolineaceae bacterium]
MSLRLRLTLLYAFMMGGGLFIFGAMVYGTVSVILFSQIDSSLAHEAERIVAISRVNDFNKLDPRELSSYVPATNISFQFWHQEDGLLIARPVNILSPLDPANIDIHKPIFSRANLDEDEIRVLSVPLSTNRGEIGVVQISYDLSLINSLLQTLVIALIFLALISMLFSGIASSLAIGNSLAPLSRVTQVAAQITNADDLNSRIPLTGSKHDEVGQLIQSFNATLERLEILFLAQRRFLADVSHDLRTPLTVIKGNVGIMKNLKEADPESLESIDSEVDRLTRLVGDLLFLAQAESGNLPMNMKKVNFDMVVVEVFEEMTLLAGDKLNISIAAIDPIQVMGDRDRLKQVVLNLVSNAVQYTPAGGKVTIKLIALDDKVEFQVVDTGPGIPQEDLDNIFERFYRGEKSRKRQSKSGFGLGLSIAHWIVEKHGGCITVDSVIGAGTTFSFVLPLGDYGGRETFQLS